MFKASNLFALFNVFVLSVAVAVAQTPNPSKQKEREVEVIVNGDAVASTERGFQFFADDGGSYLGVQTQEITKENFSKFGLSSVRGVAVEKVMDNSPAKQAGLQDGDVIVSFNGEEITSYRKLTRLISETAPDHQAKITILRGGSEKELTVTMGKRQMPKFQTGNFTRSVPPMPKMPESGEEMSNLRIWRDGMPLKEGEFGLYPPTFNGDILVWQGDKEGGNFVFGSTKQIGVGVSPLTKQLGDYFGVADGKGILINNVLENSPAAKADLKAGDVIVEVEGKAVSNSLELIRRISEKKEGEVTLTILRNRNRQTVKVTPEKMKEGEAPLRFPGEPNGKIRVQSMPRVRVASPTRVPAPARIQAIPKIL